MDLSQSPNDDVIDVKSNKPEIGISITPCDDSKSSTSDPNSAHIQSPSKYKLPISITDLWRIRRKEKLKKRFSAKNLMLANDDGDNDSDSYSFDHDSLATPSVNTSQIDPSVDSDNGEFSWSSDNSPERSHSSSLESASPEESWGSPPYGNIQRDSHGSSEDPLSQEENSRRASVCTIIDSHSRSPKSLSIPKSSISGSSSEDNSKLSEYPVDENEEFKQLMRDKTIASFSNKKKNSNGGSDESINGPKEQVRRLSIIVDPIDLLSTDYISSTLDNFPLLKHESCSDSSQSENPKPDDIITVGEKNGTTITLPDVVSESDDAKSKGSERNDGHKKYLMDTKFNDSSTKGESKIELKNKVSDDKTTNTNNKGNIRSENSIIKNIDNSSNEKRNITESLEFRKLEKSIGLGIDKSCFWCCEIL